MGLKTVADVLRIFTMSGGTTTLALAMSTYVKTKIGYHLEQRYNTSLTRSKTWCKSRMKSEMFFLCRASFIRD